ncbi:MAG: hypothetical protein WCG29_08540 [Desulfomonile sp.]|nr:hypothetical protein [Deltaproteobacteria bacterium]
MEEHEIKELIRKEQVNGRISCKTALKLADQTGAPRQKLGSLLNEMGIKIHSCQLGCFK